MSSKIGPQLANRIGQTGEDYPHGSSGDRLLRHYALLVSEAPFIKRAVIYGFVISVIVSLILPARYESTARIVPPSENKAQNALKMLSSNTAGTNDILSVGGLVGLDSGDDSPRFVAILKSRTVLDRMIDRFDLRKVYGVGYMVLAEKALQSRTEITLDRKTQIIMLTVWDRDKHRAQQLANAYIEELNRVMADLNTSDAHRERLFLEGRLVEVKKQLDEANKRLSEYSSKNGVLKPEDQGKAMVESAATLQGLIISAQSELRGLQQIYSDNNVRVREVKARIGELTRQLQNMAGVESASGDDAHNPQLYPSMRSLPALGAGYAGLYRDAKIQEVVYETLTKQLELAKVNEAKELPVARVLDPGDLAEVRAAPKRKLIVMISVAATFFFAIFWVLAADQWNRLSPEHPARVIAWSVGDAVSQNSYALRARSYSTSLLKRFQRRNGHEIPHE
jgi:capsule polysaccharide export protein KpsE/RkpR